MCKTLSWEERRKTRPSSRNNAQVDKILSPREVRVYSLYLHPTPSNINLHNVVRHRPRCCRANLSIYPYFIVIRIRPKMDGENHFVSCIIPSDGRMFSVVGMVRSATKTDVSIRISTQKDTYKYTSERTHSFANTQPYRASTFNKSCGTFILSLVESPTSRIKPERGKQGGGPSGSNSNYRRISLYTNSTKWMLTRCWADSVPSVLDIEMRWE